MVSDGWMNDGWWSDGMHHCDSNNEDERPVVVECNGIFDEMDFALII